MTSSRRTFLKYAAATAATPFILPSRIWAAETKPNSKVGMGFVGMGTQNRGLLGGFLGQDTQVLAVCDVDTTRREAAKKRVDEFYSSQKTKPAACAAYNDFRELLDRKDIDAVCIATPDHWHAIITLAALRSGKDVYCEKPLTHNIHEAVEVMKAVDANNRVLQTGSMQRSMKEFRIACEIVRNGCIGRIKKVECSFGDPGVPCDLGKEPMEPGLDWNFWVGPAPMRPYNSILSPRGIHKGFPAWRRYREFGGGSVCDFGAHHLDIAQWGLETDDTGPVEVRPPQKKDDKRGVKLVYASGITVEHKNGPQVHFYGSGGEVMVGRGEFVCKIGNKLVGNFPDRKSRVGSCAAEVQKAERVLLKDAKVRLYVSKNHISDFMACVATRKKPITSEQVGGRSAICCHLMNLAYYHRQLMKWDPTKFEFVGGTGDPKWLTCDYRTPWSV
jgi:predicted dehydrogenase